MSPVPVAAGMPCPGPVTRAVVVVLFATGSLGSWGSLQGFRGELGKFQKYFDRIRGSTVPQDKQGDEEPYDETDTDADGVPDRDGAFPNDPPVTKDTDENTDGDGDGVGGNADEDPKDPTVGRLQEEEKPVERTEPPAKTPGEPSPSIAPIDEPTPPSPPSGASPPPEAIQALFNVPRQFLMDQVEKYTSIQLPKEWKQRGSWMAIGATLLALDLCLATLVGLCCSIF